MTRAVTFALLTFALCAGTSHADPLHLQDLPSLLVEDFRPGPDLPGTRTTTAYTYDSAGRLLRELLERDTFADGSVDLRVTTTFTYDWQGNVISEKLERDFYADSVVDETELTISKYNHLGLRISLDTVRTTPYSGLVTESKTRFTYDAPRRLIRERTDNYTDFDADVDRISIAVYAYNHHGKMESRKEVIVTDYTSVPLILVNAYEYDWRGNLELTRSLTDFNGDGTVDSIQTTHASFDRRSLVDEVTLLDFNADGAPESIQGMHRSYDSDGNLLTDTQVWDDLGDGSIEQGTVETFSYDAAGRLTDKLRATFGGPFPGQTTASRYFY